MLLSQVATGDMGTMQTISAMRRLVNMSLVDSIVVQTARSLAAQSMPRDRDAQAYSIQAFLKEHFQFVNDPRGVELLVPPKAMLQTIARRGVVTGDCDEAAILGAALGKAIGIRACFVVLGFRGPRGPLSHVYTVLRGSSGWVSLDITRPERGPFPPVSRHTNVEV